MAEHIGKRLEKQEPKQKKAKKPSRLTKGQKWLLAVAIILAVVLLGVVAWDALFVKPDLPGNGTQPDGTPTENGIDYGDGIQPRVSGERKSQDYYTVLILGRDTGGGGNTDTMLLASYDVTNQKATVMSIPRDTMVSGSTLSITMAAAGKRASGPFTRRSPSWWALRRITRSSWSGRPWARSWTPWAACISTCPGT